ncbi:unnamed protein product, partial [Prunus brigantina]
MPNETWPAERKSIRSVYDRDLLGTNNILYVFFSVLFVEL